MDLQQAIELIEKSAHVGILLSKEPSLDCLASAEVLTRALEARGKKVGFISPTNAGKLTRPTFFKTVSASSPLPKEFIISYDTRESPVAELRYEKQGDEINIILSPKSLPLKKDFVSFREGKFICDCIISLGVADAESSEIAAGIDPAFLTETPLLNIDISDHNKHYGEVNLVDITKASLAETVYGLLVALQEKPLDQESATLLLSAIISQTKGFSSAQTTADTLLASSELMRLGAKNSEAFGLLAESQNPNLVQLFGRAKVRSKFEEGKGLLWSFLTADDFQKTGRSPKDLGDVLEDLDSSFPAHKTSLLLWQDPGGTEVKATLGGERALLESIKTRTGGEFKSPYLELTSTFVNFREAEEKLNVLLQEVF